MRTNFNGNILNEKPSNYTSHNMIKSSSGSIANNNNNKINGVSNPLASEINIRKQQRIHRETNL